MRAIALPAALWLLSGSPIGCGHEVVPTEQYRDPSSLPQAEELVGFPTPVGVNIGWLADPAVFAVIDGWWIYRATGENLPPEDAYARITPAVFVESSFIDTNVEDGVLYWYRLTSVSPAGVEGLPTFPVSVRVDYTPPSPPTGLAASVLGGSVQLSWDAHPELLEHFNLYRVPPDPPRIYGPLPPDAPRFVDTGVAGGVAYRYWVTAVDPSLNESAPGETVSVTIPLAGGSAPE